MEGGEGEAEALRRELREEVGIEDFEIGPLLWESERYFRLEPGFCGQVNRNYLVRVPLLEARVISEADEARWFSLDEIERSPAAPHDLRQLLSSASDW